MSPLGGAKFNFLSANVVQDTPGNSPVPSCGNTNFKGKRLAFIGMSLWRAPSIVTPSGAAGLELKDGADAVNRPARDLKRRGVNAAAVLLHKERVVTSSINGCTSVSGAIVDIVSRHDNAIYAMASGHTYQTCKRRLFKIVLAAISR